MSESFFKKWMVYYVDRSGMREAGEYINAFTREEAINHYRTYFNVTGDLEVRAVPVFEREDDEKKQKHVKRMVNS